MAGPLPKVPNLMGSMMTNSRGSYGDLAFGYEGHPQTHTYISHPPLTMHGQSFASCSTPRDSGYLSTHCCNCSGTSIAATPSALLGKEFWCWCCLYPPTGSLPLVVELRYHLLCDTCPMLWIVLSFMYPCSNGRQLATQAQLGDRKLSCNNAA